jgi:hypothetical protein
MPREKETYRENLEELRARFPGRETISVPEAAAYLGVTKERLFADETFPKRPIGKQTSVVLVNFARWLAW